MNRDNNPDCGDDGAQAEAALADHDYELAETVHGEIVRVVKKPNTMKEPLSRAVAPAEVEGLVAETEARLDAFIRPERTVIEKLLASIRSLAAKCAELEERVHYAEGTADANIQRAEAAEVENDPIDPRHFYILVEAMAEIKATSDGLSDQSISDIVQGCIDEIGALTHPAPSDVAVEQETEAVTLEECPIGLFYCGDELCLKTEYGNNEGRIDAYIVSSGEFFWGGAKNIAEQREVLVRRAAAKFQGGNPDA